MEKTNKEIFLETRMSEKLQWIVCSNDSVFQFTDRTDFIISCYGCQYKNSKGNYNSIYIIERHEMVFDENYADTRELKTYEVIVISENKKIADLNEYNVPKELFFDFINKAINSQMETNEDLL